MLRTLVVLLALCGEAHLAPISGQSSTLGSVDLSLAVFDQSSAKSADTNKSYVIFAFDNDSCVGDKEARCKEFETAMNDAKTAVLADSAFAKYQQHLIFGKANKDDFPDHKQDFEKAKVTLPAVLFWPAGHSRPSCKYDTPKPESSALTQWLESKLKDDDDDDLLELDEGEEPAAVDPSLLVCQADGGPNIVAKDDLSCGDLMDVGTPQQLMQLEKTQKIWDYKSGSTKFLGPADNSLPHTTQASNVVTDVPALDSSSYRTLTNQNKWVAMYFSAPWCHYCSCLEPVWQGVATNLVGSQRQPDLVVTKVDGDSNPELRNLFNVTVYPTFLLVNKDGTKVLGRYLGPRKVFELSTWVNDLIVAAENPVVKHQFDVTEQGAHADLYPVFPYTGPAASKVVGEQSLVSMSVSLSGNDFDDCVDSDEMKFTSPGVALLVHYPSSASTHALEADNNLLSTTKVAEKLTVVDFMVPWCPHCQKLNPVWDQLSSRFADRTDLLVVKVDLEQHPDMKRDFNIHRFPTVVYFEPGKPMTYDEAHRFSGQRDADHLQQWIDQISAH